MKNRYINAFITASLSIIPMMLIICVLSWTNLAPLSWDDGHYLLLIIGTIVLIVGLAVFSVGASSSLTKVGEYKLKPPEAPPGIQPQVERCVILPQCPSWILAFAPSAWMASVRRFRSGTISSRIHSWSLNESPD